MLMCITSHIAFCMNILRKAPLSLSHNLKLLSRLDPNYLRRMECDIRIR